MSRGYLAVRAVARVVVTLAVCAALPAACCLAAWWCGPL